MWADINFASFAFDLLALLNGTYRSGFMSTCYKRVSPAQQNG